MRSSSEPDFVNSIFLRAVLAPDHRCGRREADRRSFSGPEGRRLSISGCGRPTRPTDSARAAGARIGLGAGPPRNRTLIHRDWRRYRADRLSQSVQADSIRSSVGRRRFLACPKLAPASESMPVPNLPVPKSLANPCLSQTYCPKLAPSATRAADTSAAVRYASPGRAPARSSPGPASPAAA